MRIGIFGGSFDPIHLGHLILAEQCRALAGLDQVWFVPCAMSPHKQGGAFGTNRQRKEMIELAIAGHEAFGLSTIELDRGGVSYTVDTLKSFSETHAQDEFFFLMGDDSLENFLTWKDPEEICRLATPLIVNRPGSGVVDLGPLKDLVSENRFAEIKDVQIESPLIDIQSREIRQRVAEEITVRYMLPRSVERYIQTQKIYLELK